jgi:hypothetical protein
VVVILVAALVAVVALSATLATGVLLRDKATPTSVRDGLRRFRADDPKPAAGDGVYVYATRGFESIDVLGGARHPYPATSALTAIAAGCGTRIEWRPLEGRSTSWTLCRTDRGIELRAYEEMHQFFGQTDATSYACVDALLLPGGPVRRYRCSSGRDRETATVRTIGSERVEVGRRALLAVHVRTVALVSGRDTGVESVDWWLAPETGIPLRMVVQSRTSRPLLLGRVHYREQAA